MASCFAGYFRVQAPYVASVALGFAGNSLPQAPYVAPIPFCFAGTLQSQASNVEPVRRFADRSTQNEPSGNLAERSRWACRRQTVVDLWQCCQRSTAMDRYLLFRADLMFFNLLFRAESPLLNLLFRAAACAEQ